MKRILIALLFLASCTGECTQPHECSRLCGTYGVRSYDKANGCVCNTEIHCTGGTAK